MFNCLNWSLKICLGVHHFVRQWIRLWDKSVEKLEMWKGPDGNPWYEERTGELINPKLINLAAVTLATGWIVYHLYYWHACFCIFKEGDLQNKQRDWTNSQPDLVTDFSFCRIYWWAEKDKNREDCDSHWLTHQRSVFQTQTHPGIWGKPRACPNSWAATWSRWVPGSLALVTWLICYHRIWAIEHGCMILNKVLQDLTQCSSSSKWTAPPNIGK